LVGVSAPRGALTRDRLYATAEGKGWIGRGMKHGPRW